MPEDSVTENMQWPNAAWFEHAAEEFAPKTLVKMHDEDGCAWLVTVEEFPTDE